MNRTAESRFIEEFILTTNSMDAGAVLPAVVLNYRPTYPPEPS